MALAATGVALQTAALAAGRFLCTLQVTGAVDIDIHTGAGDIRVRTGGTSTVEVTGTIESWGRFFSGDVGAKRVRYLESHPPIEQQGNTIKIGAFVDPDMQRNVSIHYELIVPVNTRITSSTGSGTLKVDGILGPLSASAGSGVIKASNIGASVVATAGSGEIVLESIKDKARVSTGSGSIRITRVLGGVQASTGGGDVTLEQAGPGDAHIATASGDIVVKKASGLVHARTVSGSISAEGGGQSPWYLESVSGDVSVRVPLHQGFALRANTVSGNISVRQPLTLQGTTSRREITGKAGGGGSLLSVSTASGNVQIDWLA